MEKWFLVTNPGSSSRKYALYHDDALVCSLHFEMEGKDVVCTLKKADGSREKLTEGFSKLTDTVKYVKDILTDEGYLDKNNHLSAVLARVVATGDYFATDHLVDDECLRQLEIGKKRAPLHVPVVAAEIESCVKEFDGTPVIIISDSSFHTSRDDVHTYYAIDKDLADKAEIKRYGFHGLSMGSISGYLKEAGTAADKVIACHIGSGSSVTALYKGASFDTTMGYTPLEGVMMATRCGDIDATAAIAIGRELGLEGEKLEEYLNKQCGLKGLAGNDDMREVLSLRADGDPKAKLAYEMYIYRMQRAIGQMAASMQGVDALVFTATIGERNAEIRRDIVSGLGYLGFKINDTKNDDGIADGERHCVISANSSKPIYVIFTDETGEMIRRARLLLDK